MNVLAFARRSLRENWTMKNAQGALVGMIAAEFFLSATGLGQLIMSASQNFDTGGVFASILIIGLLGIGLTRLGLVIEQHFARWRQ